MVGRCNKDYRQLPMIMYHRLYRTRFLGKCKGWSRVRKVCLVLRASPNKTLLLRIAMFGNAFGCLLFASLCLNGPFNSAGNQISFQTEGTPVLRRFNVTSPTQLEKTLDKALVRTRMCGGRRYAQDKVFLRTTALTSGMLPRTTSMSTSPQTRPDHP
jgi:hypothetical protein